MTLTLGHKEKENVLKTHKQTQTPGSLPSDTCCSCLGRWGLKSQPRLKGGQYHPPPIGLNSASPSVCKWANGPLGPSDREERDQSIRPHPTGLLQQLLPPSRTNKACLHPHHLYLHLLALPRRDVWPCPYRHCPCVVVIPSAHPWLAQVLRLLKPAQGLAISLCTPHSAPSFLSSSSAMPPAPAL